MVYVEARTNVSLCRYDMSTLRKLRDVLWFMTEFDTILTPNAGSVRASQVFLCDYGNILSGLVENRLIEELHDR